MNTAPPVRSHKYCIACGLQINNLVEVCPRCGAKQQEKVSSTRNTIQHKNKMVAALLAFFFGSWGAHKFYLNDIKLGFLYLAFFWTFIPAIFGVIEGIIYLKTSDQEFARQYG